MRFLKKDGVRSMGICFSILFLAAHAFCYLNLTLSGNGILIDASRDTSRWLAAGAWLQPLYFRLRGVLGAPLLVGLLTGIYLFAAAVLLCDLLKIRGTLPQCLVCGTLALSTAVLEQNAASVVSGDSYALALLLGVAACRAAQEGILGLGVSFAFGAASVGLDGALWVMPAALLFVRLAAREETDEPIVRFVLKALPAFAGALLSLALLFVQLKRYRLGGGLRWIGAEELTGGLKWLFASLTTSCFLPWKPVQIALRLAALIAAAAAVLGSSGERANEQRVRITVCAAGLFLTLAMPGFAAKAYPQYTLVRALIPILAIALVFSGGDDRARIWARTAVTAALCVSFMGGFIYANQVYLKKDLEFQTTLSLMTRVIDRAEQVPGYKPGATPVAILGSAEDSQLTAEHAGFEHLAALRAASSRSSILSESDMTWYLWGVLAYPFNLVSAGERDALAQQPEVREMPLFPEAGSCAMVGNTLVIRLSDR